MSYKSSREEFEKNEPFYNRHPELVGVGLILIATLILMSILSFQQGSPSLNTLGLFGYGIAFSCFVTFGIACYPLAAIIGWIGLKLIFYPEKFSRKKLIALVLTFLGISLGLTLAREVSPSLEYAFASSIGALHTTFRLGGTPAFYIYKNLPYCNLERLLNFTGTLLLTIAAFVLSLGYIFEEKLQKALTWIKEQIALKKQEFAAKREARQEELKILRELEQEAKELEELGSSEEKEDAPIKYRESSTKTEKEPHSAKYPSLLSRSIELPPSYTNIPESLYTKPKFDIGKDIDFAPIEEPQPPAAKPKPALPKPAPKIAPVPLGAINYKIPGIDLLNAPKRGANAELKKELKQKADLLEETLSSFGIEAKVGQIYSGPTITSFEVHPAVGVKVGRIKTLEHDIALNLEAKSIRIIAPIPGKAAVGIEVPNKHPQEVTFKELLHAYQNLETKFRIPMLLGKTVNGDFVMNDLTKMPHCIIAGATGSGKSVCINSIVMSILLTATPDEIRLIMVDPKKVELTPYSDLPHLLAPVITEPKTACIALNWLVKEMEKRYEMLKLTGQRNIDGFNKRKIDPEFEKTLGIQIPEKLAYYVAIIDELADLMMVAAQDIETPIARIAQMARAVGIHLILATQRPSREVITGIIKANFPARISFKVASRVNSMIILDEIGAETLLGNGDMLLLQPGSSQLIRAQGVFVRDEEILRAVEYISKQMPPQYIISSFDRLQEEGFAGGGGDEEPSDSLFEDAKSTILSTGNASTTFLQRKLKVGYARAASLMDELEKKGIVGPQEGAKPRKIYFPKMSAVSQDPDFEKDFDE
jgi:DNA segregation ATPase FtsK/SpoIIIE, S-DNA-T family